MASPSGLIPFDMGMSMAARVHVISPIINMMIEDHDSGDSSLGVEAFQEDLIGRIRAAGLMENKWIMPSCPSGWVYTPTIGRRPH